MIKGILNRIFRNDYEDKASKEDIIRYSPDLDMGLVSSQVERRVAERLTNIPVKKETNTVSKIILSNVFTYFNLIFFVLALILLIEGSYNNLTFLIVIFVNIIIGIIQEIKAKKVLENLTLISAPVLKVIRDGREDLVSSEELVLDDIVILEAGKQIPADSIVCDGEITVNESLVTGESDEIKKTVGDILLSGSFVVSGSCRAKLDKVGSEAFVSQLTLDAKKIKRKERSGMMKSLTVLIKIIGIIIIPFSLIMFFNQHEILKLSVKESIENTAASIIGMIPEGLYLLTTVALAVSVMRLAKKKTLVHDMKCIETLARVDVICVDKTGTITEPNMKISRIISLDSDAEGEYSAEKKLCDFVLNMNADNDTMKALKEYFKDTDFRIADKIKGFSSKIKYSAVAFGDTAYVLGAPEFLLKNEFESFKNGIEQYSSAGERVLLFAEYQYKKGSYDDIFDGGALNGLIIPLAVVTLENKVRPEAKETFNYFTEQGVTIKVISGDNPLTAARAAKAAGIPDSDKYIDATLLDTKEKIESGILEYNVFGRVTPEQKRQLIRALKKHGHTVAMTGDGVNDILALKDADCSIAMASGSDAAASVSDLVLLNSDFSSMPAVVAEGRRVINNIERSASLFLVKNIFSFILTVITLISTSSYPFKPAQLSLVSAVMIGIPSFCLALEPNAERVRGKFLRNIMFKAAPAAITAVILVGWSLLFTHAFGIKHDMSSTTAFYLYSFVAYMMLYKVCRPMNLFHKILFGAMGILMITAITFLPEMFEISNLNFGSLLVLVTLAIIAVPLNVLIGKLFDRLAKLIQKIKKFIKKDI